MDNDRSSRQNPDISLEACAWIAQLETGQLSPADLEAFREWLRRSPRHAREIRQLARLNMDLNVLTEMADPISEAARQYQAILQKRPKRSKILVPGVIAFASMAVIALGAIFFSVTQDHGKHQPMLVETPIGGYREITLDDGSLVKLNTNSKMEVDYDEGMRKVRLLSGEAYFQVAHNPNRPFVVYADSKNVRAVGTAFVVRFLPEDFAVTVVEGKVELAQTTEVDVSNIAKIDQQATASAVTGNKPANVASAPVPLSRGERYSVSHSDAEGTVVSMSTRDLQRELSWQEGLLEFSDTPLEDVVKELSRYVDLNVEFVDPELQTIKFGGIFRKSESKALFEVLQNTYGINVEYADNKVRLSLAAKQHN